MAIMKVLFALALSFLLGCARGPKPGGLLEGKQPSSASGVANAERITDGTLSLEGDPWDSDTAARFTDPRGFLEYDLSAVHPIACALLQGDNNDDYQLLGSLDGSGWTTIFHAGPVSGAGLRTRLEKVSGSARYLRITASGGDNSYAIAEAAAYEVCPNPWPPELTRTRGNSPFLVARDGIYLFAAALIFFVILHRRGKRLSNLSALPPLIAFAWLLPSLIEVFPLFELETLIRGVVAALALAVLIREACSPERYRPDARWMKATLSFLAVAAVGCYVHFGALQFNDAGKQRHTFVHGFDMRHYFPLAKYFNELKFDGLYDASLAAYVDLHPGMTLAEVGSVKLRDLSNAEVRDARDLTPQLLAVRARFSSARWSEFTRDMGYFLSSMGPDGYLGTMRDHGGNATPVWILGAHLLFAHAPASELTLTLAGLIDPLLILLLIVAIWRSFGARVALYTAILFGATDFYQFGTNMFGSTLRQDWLALIGFGACAIRTKRAMLGGFLLAYAGLIRAFPAVCVLMLPVPILWAIFDRLRSRLKLNLRDILIEQIEPLRAIAGAALALIVLVGGSSALFGFHGSWVSWAEKIKIHATGPSINSVALRAAVMYEPEHIAQQVIRNDLAEPWEDWQRYQNAAFERRRPAFLMINFLILGLVIFAARKRPLEQVAMLGLLTIAFLFYPSNYYCHYIFLLPLAAVFNQGNRDEPEDRFFAWGVATLLGLCIAQAFTMTMDVGWSDVRYAAQSFELVIASVCFAIPLAWRQRAPKAASGRMAKGN
jgi:hypothetical protein